MVGCWQRDVTIPFVTIVVLCLAGCGTPATTTTTSTTTTTTTSFPPVAIIPSNGEWALKFSANDDVLLADDGTSIELWNMIVPEAPTMLSSVVSYGGSDLSADGLWLLSFGKESGCIPWYIYSLEAPSDGSSMPKLQATIQPLPPPGTSADCNAFYTGPAVLSGDGSVLVTTVGTMVEGHQQLSFYSLADLSSPERTAFDSLPSWSSTPTSASLSTDGAWLALGGSGERRSTLRSVTTPPGTAVPFEGEEEQQGTVVLSADGSMLASWGTAGVEIWSLKMLPANGRLLSCANFSYNSNDHVGFLGRDGRIAFSGDASWVAMQETIDSDKNGQVNLYHVIDGLCALSLRAVLSLPNGEAARIALSSDGALLAVSGRLGGGTTNIYNVAEIAAHSFPVLYV